MEERRKHKRYTLDNACILNHATTVGTIIDLSVGGLSCMCLDQGDCEEGLSTKVNIYCKKNDLTAQDIPIQVLSTGKMSGKFIENIGLRKCRAQFTQLDDASRAQLEHIINRTSDTF